MHVQKLSTELPPQLMRGVPSACALGGCGKHFKDNAAVDTDYLLSIVTDGIDDFISHEWRTPRSVKYMTLSYIYNSKAALLGSTLLTGLLVLVKELMTGFGLLRSRVDGELELAATDFVAFTLVCPIVYVLLLFHWQNIRRLFGQTTLLFVDKLCIAQEDEHLKRQGILGLAAFLKKSRRLVVLWSPAYFSRLWCTYELAAWFRLQREVSSVLFLPVEIAPIVLYVFGLIAASCCLYYLDLIVEPQQHRLMLYLALIFLNWATSSYVVQGLVSHVHALKTQLGDFLLEKTCCFCCSNGHVNPKTGGSIACDREMVYTTLKQWATTPTGEGNDDAHISAFNKEVRTTLRQHVRHSLPEHRLFLRYEDLLHAGAPHVWYMLDRIIFGLNRGSFDTVDAMASLSTFFMWTLALPLACLLLLRLMLLARPLTAGVEGSVTKKLITCCCLWGPVGIFAHGGITMCLHADTYFYVEALGHGYAWFIGALAFALLTCAAFAGSAWRDAFSGRFFSLTINSSQLSAMASEATVTSRFPSEEEAVHVVQARETPPAGLTAVVPCHVPDNASQ
eukprot:TRINITY_DN28027_c0_g1_i1.p1 TRINITY_DN28027_c0_g1~~TRINITY_DN28027_c0_g1_i1.p1  ORF type:complete len:563 (+),score=39.36 TRINITY_DN28027_c0_g1_i1:73-1761(+)